MRRELLSYYDDSLELNIRQLILSDLAESVGDVKGQDADADDVVSAIDLITSRVETRQLSKSCDEQHGLPNGHAVNGDSHKDDEAVAEERVFMVCNYSFPPSNHLLIPCSRTLGCNAISVLRNSPSTCHIRTLKRQYLCSSISCVTSHTLISIVASRGMVRFYSLSRGEAFLDSLSLEWAMPDQLVSTTVTALLKIAGAHPKYRRATFDAIVNLVKEIVPRFQTEDCEYSPPASAPRLTVSLSIRRSVPICPRFSRIVQGHHFHSLRLVTGRMVLPRRPTQPALLAGDYRTPQ